MVDSQRLGHDIDDAIDTGRDNSAIRADAEGWCEHLAVETLGISPLGQMAGVPIGPHRLSCQYAQYATGSVVLRHLFRDFLVNNCVGCDHHKPGGRAEFGQACLAAAQEGEAKARKAESERGLQIETLRRELVEMAAQRAETAQPEAASVLRLTADLFEETELNATQMLCETCEVASELFEEKVIDLLEVGVSDEVFAAKCLPVLANLARKNPAIRDRIRPRVIESSQLRLPIELISDSLEACLSDDAKEITDQVIDNLVASQDYQHPFGGWADGKEPVFSMTVGLLAKLIDLVETRVSTVIEERLEINEKWPRANTCRVVEELSKLRPNFGLRVLPKLIHSLELADDIYEGVSADGSATRAVSELLVLKWAEAEEILRIEMPRLSMEAQSVLVGAYENLFRRGQTWRDETTDGLDDGVVKGAVTRCLELLNDTAQEPAVRRAAAEAIRSACAADVQLALDAFDQLLGCLAMVVEANQPPKATPTIILPGYEEQQRQDEMLRQQDRAREWTRLKQELAQVIEEIGERNPLEVGNALIATIDTATSADHQPLRLATLKLLGRIASHEPELSIVAIPSLMLCLMDYSSAAVRAVAIDAVKDAFRHSHLTLPSNVVDVLVLHLRDQYVMVHQAIVRTFGIWHIQLTDSQRNEAFTSLFYIWKACAENPGESFFMHDIADALLCVADDNTKMQHVTLSLICDYLPTARVLVDSKLCEMLARKAEPDASISVKVGKALIGCLARHSRDSHRNGRDWREDAADWLSALSNQVWQLVSADFSDCARQASRKDPGEALLFAAVLCEHGEHAEEAEVLMAAAESAEGHSLFHGLSEPLQKLRQQALVARGEVDR